MVKDPDFELHNVEKALSVIQEKGLGGEAVVSQMSDLVRQVNNAVYISVVKRHWQSLSDNIEEI